MTTHPIALPKTAPRAAFAKILLNEGRLAWRTPFGLGAGVVVPALLVVLFGELPKYQVHKASLGGLTLFNVEVPVLIGVEIAVMALLSLPMSLATYREQGILRRLSTTPARPSWVLGAQVAVNLILALGALVIIMVVGSTAFAEQAPKSTGGFVLSVVLSLSALFAIGLFIAARAKTGMTAYATGFTVLFPLMFFAGLWFPRQQMTPWLSNVSNYTPLGAASQAIQDSIQGSFPPAALLLTLAGCAIAFGFLAVRCFRWE
jgi:ABC-2 type transport system permease protein